MGGGWTSVLASHASTPLNSRGQECMGVHSRLHVSSPARVHCTCVHSCVHVSTLVHTPVHRGELLCTHVDALGLEYVGVHTCAVNEVHGCLFVFVRACFKASPTWSEVSCYSLFSFRVLHNDVASTLLVALHA